MADETTPGAPAPTSDAAVGPTLEEVGSWAGHRLDDIAGTSVGKVEGACVDAASGKPEWLLSRMGRFGHYTLIPARDAVAGVGHIWVPYSRDQIRAAPKVEPKKDVVREQELELLQHYRIGGPAGRAAEVNARPAQSVTARPAG